MKVTSVIAIKKMGMSISSPFCIRRRNLYRTCCFNSRPGLNFGARLAGTLIVSPVRGLRAVLAFLFATENVPNPTSATLSPLFKAAVTFSTNVSSAILAALFEIFAFAAIFSISSAFVICVHLLSVRLANYNNNSRFVKPQITLYQCFAPNPPGDLSKTCLCGHYATLSRYNFTHQMLCCAMHLCD